MKGVRMVAMAKRPTTYEARLHIDMPFGEALERFIGVKPDEMHANIAKSKKKKPPGGTKSRVKHGPPGGSQDITNPSATVVKLGDRRARRRNKGY